MGGQSVWDLHFVAHSKHKYEDFSCFLICSLCKWEGIWNFIYMNDVHTILDHKKFWLLFYIKWNGYED